MSKRHIDWYSESHQEATKAYTGQLSAIGSVPNLIFQKGKNIW